MASDLIERLIHQALTDALREAPELSGFALKTDDNVQTLFHVVLHANTDDEDVRFGTYDWSDTLDNAAFEEAAQTLARLASETSGRNAKDARAYEKDAFMAMVSP